MTTTNEFLPVSFKSESLSTQEIKAARDAEYELAQKAAAGDIDAFEQIFWRYHRRVFSICVRMTKNTEEAEDITQQVFLNLYRKIGSFRGDAAFSTWLHRMTVNQLLMHFRAQKSRKEETTDDGELRENDFTGNQKSMRTNQIIEKFQLNQLIAKLPDGYRKIFILHDVQGFEHDEIARILGCAVGTSKSQLFKARRKLRRLLATDESADNKIHAALG